MGLLEVVTAFAKRKQIGLNPIFSTTGQFNFSPPINRKKEKNMKMPINDYKCNFCGEEFKQVKAGSFANHKRWCKKNPRFEDILNSTIQKLNACGNKRQEERELTKVNKTLECEKCSGLFTRLLLPNQQARFCSISCANSKTHSQETKDKLRKALLIYESVECIICQKVEIVCFKHFRKNKLCSEECYNTLKEQRKRERQKHLTAKEIYKKSCSFTFSVYNYPEEFDLKLLEEFGWYKPKNRGDNLNGISRDHMLSRTYGFENNIPVEHLKHPANCQLLVHSKNISKGKKSSISYEELLERINSWNKKY